MVRAHGSLISMCSSNLPTVTSLKRLDLQPCGLQELPANQILPIGHRLSLLSSVWHYPKVKKKRTLLISRLDPFFYPSAIKAFLFHLMAPRHNPEIPRQMSMPRVSIFTTKNITVRQHTKTRHTAKTSPGIFLKPGFSK